MNKKQIEEIVGQVTYKGWSFYVGDKNGVIYLQAQFDQADSFTGKVERQSGRKWMLSEHMVKSEIVQTAWAAVQFAETHEMRESFKFKGRRIFGPHFDVDALTEIVDDKRLDYRGKAKSNGAD